MGRQRLSGIFTGGFGRRILGLFLVAGVLPVLFTAYLAYNEVHKGLKLEVDKQLRENAKSYGVEILARLQRASDKAGEVIRVMASGGIRSVDEHRYLLDEFDSITILSDTGHGDLVYGTEPPHIDPSIVDSDHLAAGMSQLVVTDDRSDPGLILLRANERDAEETLAVAFRLKEVRIWGPRENLPYLTEFCVHSVTGSRLFCTQEMDDGIYGRLVSLTDSSRKTPEETVIGGEKYLAAIWQLFMDGRFRHSAFDIVASQPKAHALGSSADFRWFFLPALGLVVILVGLLSFNFIGKSLVPLQRLTIVARQFADGHLTSRVRVKTGDEFEWLADAFNNMAGRLGRQIATLNAMSAIDRLILSGAKFEEVSETVIRHAIELSGCEVAAVLAKDNDAPTWAKMISMYQDECVHERIALPQELGHQWHQPRQAALRELDAATAPYKTRFESYSQEFVVAIPVVRNDELKGVLLLGAMNGFDLEHQRIKRCVDLAGRYAVALASVEREEFLYRQAHFDDLTGLPNRQLLKDRLGQQLVRARREGKSGALLFLDLDRFKEINDFFGHSVGDVVLRQAAERIVTEVRDTDTVARLGGDEFVVVMPQMHGDSTVTSLASRLLGRLAEAFSVRGTDHYVSASIGIVVYPDDGDSVETLLKNADSAMYRAKDAGRSRFEFFSEKLNAASRRKIDLERDLRIAFSKNELELYYQPQFETTTGVISGAEALLRWRRGGEEFVSPAEFVPLAEESSLIIDIGRWVIEQSCVDLKNILDKGLHPGPVSINVSARQLREPSFSNDVLEPLRRYGIHPGYIQLEVTETTVAQNRDTAIDILDILRAEGVRVAIDDFGTGYSSLSYLQQMPFDVIKIDKSFVDLIGTGNTTDNICRTIIKMAHELGKKSIAEGAETREQIDFLSHNGCDFVQGFFYSEPLPNSEFVEFIEQQDFHTMRRKALEVV